MKDIDYKFIKLKSLENGAPGYEQKLFNGLFYYRPEVLLSSLQLSFYTTMGAVKQLLSEKVKANKHYEARELKQDVP